MRTISAASLIAAIFCTAAFAGESPPVIRDKTLVAWVSPANLTQKGGSVLTIQENETFDAAVLGERAAGRWMAGSDFFRRTQNENEQAACAPETADAKTLLQIAIAYKGNQVSIYRNGDPYATYTIREAQSFGKAAFVLLGLRYLGEMGEVGFFAGAVEDARIYDVALDARQIAALKPRKLSDPKPLAWWHFQDGKPDDAMKRFPFSRLAGNARITDGRLLLDGNGYLCAATDRKLLSGGDNNEALVDNAVQTMFYKPRSKQTGNMWDTWLFHHGGTHYLYCLAKSRGQWDNISLATAPDGVHWTEQGRILGKGEGVTWMGTGSTWQSPAFAKDGKFFMNFSEWRGPRQTIFFAASNDLVHWQRLGNECEFVQDERWYEKNGRWDCIWTIPRPGGGLYGYWTATPKAVTGGRFGFGETLDGVTWKALEPPKVEGVAGGEGEVGAVEKIGQRYYMMFGIGGIMVALVADSPQGPFKAAKRNYRLLTGHTYFSRFFPMPDGVLVNHHSIARNGQVYFGTLKSTVLDADGTLRLAWWKGNEKMKAGPLEVRPPAAGAGNDARIAMLQTPLDVNKGVILEGSLALPETPDQPRRGLYIECGNDGGAAILVNAAGAAELGTMRADGSGFKAEKRVDREMAFGKPAAFRLLLKQSLLEFYLDDVLIECFSLPQNATGRVGCIGTDAVRPMSAWTCAQ